MNLELQKALEQDRKKLLGLTGEDHGPGVIDDWSEIEDWILSLPNGVTENIYFCPTCGRNYRKEKVRDRHVSRYGH